MKLCRGPVYIPLPSYFGSCGPWARTELRESLFELRPYLFPRGASPPSSEPLPVNNCGFQLSSSFPTRFLPLVHLTTIQDGWRRLKYEKVVAPAPVEEPGAGLA